MHFSYFLLKHPESKFITLFIITNPGHNFDDSILTIILISFCSIDKVSKITSPVLVIHGTEDEVIDFSHGLSIYEKCSRAVEPLWVEVGNRF